MAYRIHFQLFVLTTVFIFELATIHAQASPRSGTQRAPRIIYQLNTEEHAYKEGEDVEMKCQANAESGASYRWTKNGVDFDLSASNIVTLPDKGGSFKFIQPDASIEGYYQCFASNAFGTAVTRRTLLKKAMIDSFPTIHEVKVVPAVVGQSLSLPCKPPASYPTGTIYWSVSGSLHASSGMFTNSQLNSVETNKRVVLGYDGSLYFANVLKTDSLDGNMYVCVANNPYLGTHNEGGDLKITVTENTDSPSYISPSLMWSSPLRDVAVKGRNKKIKCIFAGLPTPDVTWEKIDSRMSERVHVTQEGHGTEIEIRRIEFDDAGVYRCSATNRHSMTPVTHDITIIVESSPFWRNDREPSDVGADEEEDVRLECQADGRPRADISWSVNGTQLDELERNSRHSVGVNGKVLSIRNVTQIDQGIYQCAASNKHGSILANLILSVEASKPSFTQSPSDTKIVVGQNANLTCDVYGAPKPKVVWLRGTPSRPVSGPRFTVHSNGMLEIKSSALNDKDVYHCEASNKFGRVAASANLLVRRPTQIDNSNLQDVVANATDEIRLRCDVTTDPLEHGNLEVEWYMNGALVDVDGDSGLSMDRHDFSLTLRSSEVKDTGGYNCRASTNDLDSATSDVVQVTVQDRPDPPRDVRVTMCTSDFIKLSWLASADNNSPISEYIVYNTNATSDEVERARVRAVGDEQQLSAVVSTHPWTTYSLHVVAVNQLGVSDRASQSVDGTEAVCQTPATRPRRNPAGVCSRLERPTQLVIVWEPMPATEHNGPGFHYRVGYRLMRGGGTMLYAIVEDADRGELVVFDQRENQKYEITVQAVNDVGEAPILSSERKMGFSGEGKPTVVPQNLRLIESTLNSTSANFTWNSVDTSFEKIKGFFRGYQLQYWRKVGNSRELRKTDIVLGEPFDPCPVLPWEPVRRRRRQSRSSGGGGLVNGAVVDLWPYSEITAGVLVLNNGNEGALSDTITFTTPEGVPEMVGSLEVIETGSSHLTIQWSPPVNHNGVLLSYVIQYKVGPPNVGGLKTMLLNDITITSQRILGLEANTNYVISVSATTRIGIGLTRTTTGTTLPASDPDMPVIGTINVGHDSANVSWFPASHDPPTNPGAEYYVEYIKESDYDAGLPWNRSDPDPTTASTGGNWAYIGNLTNGETYMFRVVAVNGLDPDKKETRSDPPRVETIGYHQVGTALPVMPASRASSDWFIILICIIALLLIILLVACIVMRSRGQIYPVYEKERQWGHDPNAPEDAPFGEYTRNNEPSDIGRSQGSLDSDDKPIDSETDSLGEYEDQDPSKFNEDGSFIGQYTRRSGTNPPRPQPAYNNTFV
jgi:receptor-type tyrosine-protein phosphatase zeta